MTLLTQQTFVCLDCETTGLEPKTDRIIEVAAAAFTFQEVLKTFETLIDPEAPISPSSIEIHHITDEMVGGKPKIWEILPDLLNMIDGHILVGHGISLDLEFIQEEARRKSIPNRLSFLRTIDTLRLARLYGESPTNSLEKLREHFNIAAEGAHRAMSDVIVNIEVFKHLTQRFKTLEELFERLERPILLKRMPLGKYKGRLFSELPQEYLDWASRANFDQDLLFSLRTELKKRKQGKQFKQASNPFSSLHYPEKSD